MLDECKIGWIGPRPEVIRLMGDKAKARQTAKAAGVPVLPGSQEPLGGRRGRPHALAAEVGYPVILKASAGGGGRGMRIVHAEEELAGQLATAREEAEKAFGDGSVYLEKYLMEPRHIEFQVFGDPHGQVVHLGERECSIQRRHQKLIEESPSPALTPELREEMGAAAVRLCEAVGYENAGTIEFLLDSDGRFYFMEMNTRIQVEHPVTEMVTGIDLVKMQIEVAAGRQAGDPERPEAARPRHRVPGQRREPGHLRAQPRAAQDLPPARRPRHARRHPRLRGLRHPAVLRLAGGQADRPRPHAGVRDRPHAPGARLLRRRGDPHLDPAPQAHPARSGLRRRPALDALHGTLPRSARGGRAAGKRQMEIGAVYAIADAGALGARAAARGGGRDGGGGRRAGSRCAPRASPGAAGTRPSRPAAGRSRGAASASGWTTGPTSRRSFRWRGSTSASADLPPAAARRVVGASVRIGLSTHDEEQLAAADADPEVDVIAVGPVFPTTGKERPDPVVGLAFVRWARERTRKPAGGHRRHRRRQRGRGAGRRGGRRGRAGRGLPRRRPEVRANCRRLLAAAAGRQG